MTNSLSKDEKINRILELLTIPDNLRPAARRNMSRWSDAGIDIKLADAERIRAKLNEIAGLLVTQRELLDTERFDTVDGLMADLNDGQPAEPEPTASAAIGDEYAAKYDSLYTPEPDREPHPRCVECGNDAHDCRCDQHD